MHGILTFMFAFNLVICHKQLLVFSQRPFKVAQSRVDWQTADNTWKGKDCCFMCWFKKNASSSEFSNAPTFAFSCRQTWERKLLWFVMLFQNCLTLYSRTPLIRPPSESHWCGRIRGMVAREGFVYEQKPLSVTRNVVVWEGWSLVRVVVRQGFYCTVIGIIGFRSCVFTRYAGGGLSSVALRRQGKVE